MTFVSFILIDIITIIEKKRGNVKWLFLLPLENGEKASYFPRPDDDIHIKKNLVIPDKAQ